MNRTIGRLRNLSRRLVWRAVAALPERDLTVRTAHGRVTFSSRDRFIGKSLFVQKQYGYPVLSLAVDILRREGLLPGDGDAAMVDVGANVGTVCLAFVGKGTFRRAVAFEPDPRNFRYLTRNVEQNGFASRITAVHAGLSSEEGELPLELSGDNFGDHRIRLAAGASEGAYGEQARPVIHVPVRRLDDVLEEVLGAGVRPGLIWMDVQGHEGHVLAGAEATLAAGVPLVTEFWPYGLQRAGTSRSEFTAMARRHFSHLYDLREAAPARRPVEEIAAMFDRYTGQKGTDLLLVPRR